MGALSRAPTAQDSVGSRTRADARGRTPDAPTRSTVRLGRKVANLFTQQPRRGIVGVRAEVHCFVWSASAAHAWREADGPERTEQRHSACARKRHSAG
jgi:hypothetical protein